MKCTIKALANLIPEGLDVTGDNDDDLITLSQQKTRIGLYNASSEDDEKYFTPLKKKQPVKAPGAFKLLSESKKQKNILFFDSEDDEDELAASTPRGRQGIRKAVKDSEDENEEAGTSTQETDGTTSQNEDKGDEDKSPVVSSARRRSRPILIISDDEDDAPPLHKLRQPSVLTRKGNKGKGRTAIDLDDSDDDKVITASPSKRRRSIAIPDDDEDDDDEPAISPLKRRKQDVESDDWDIGSSHPEHSRSTAAEDSEDDDENADEESDVPRGRTRAAHRKKQSSISPYTPSRYTRQANPPKKHRTAKQKAAELLRRKRAGEKIDQLTESSSDGEDSRGLYDSDSELEALHVFEDEEPSPESVRPATRSDSRQSEGNDANSDDEDEGFIVDDDEDHLLGTSRWAAILIC
jgi:hypothetical protein